MCTTPEQFALFSGENNDRIDTIQKAYTEKRMNHANVLERGIGREALVERHWCQCHVIHQQTQLNRSEAKTFQK